MTPQKSTEQNFEEHIEEHLLVPGYCKQKSTDYQTLLISVAVTGKIDVRKEIA